jgi:hypothetical protein
MQISASGRINSITMKTKSLAVVAIVAVAAMLVTSLVGTNSVFAGGYEKSQATAQTNYCGNGELPLNVGCQNTASQIQGDENAVSEASVQEFDD